TAALRGGRTGGRTGKGGGRIGEAMGRDGGRTGEQDGQGSDRGIRENRGVDKVLDFSTIIAQQLQDLLPTIIAQVGNHASNIQGDVRNVSSRGQEAAVGMTWEDFKVLMKMELCPNNEMQKLETEVNLWPSSTDPCEVAATEPTTIQSVVLKARMLTDEAIRNGSLRKNTEKRGKGREPSRVGNVRDDHKRSWTGRAFSSTANPV
ncbi:hypothetical protein Tco_1431262, partial [Tanacetum coccineum]